MVVSTPLTIQEGALQVRTVRSLTLLKTSQLVQEACGVTYWITMAVPELAVEAPCLAVARTW